MLINNVGPEGKSLPADRTDTSFGHIDAHDLPQPLVLQGVSLVDTIARLVPRLSLIGFALLACPVRRIVLHQRHQIARLAWARRHIRFTMADWGNVLFVDETRISLHGNDGRARVYCARGKRFNENCVVETEPFGGGSIMMFAGISMHTKTPIVRLQGAVNAVRYQNDILLPLVIPHIRANRGIILAQDNERSLSFYSHHAAASTR